MKISEVFKELKRMSEKDKRRFVQCLLCEHDPERCGCTESEENDEGYCLQYRPHGVKPKRGNGS